MAKLSISDNQNTQIIVGINPHLEDAFLEGASAPGDANALPAMDRYVDVAAADRTKVKNLFRRVIAGLIKVMNFDRVGIGTAAAPIVITVAKPSSGTITLTIIGGLIVSKTEA